MVHTLAVHIPNLLPKDIGPFHLSWTRPAGRLIWSTLLFLISTGVVFWLTRRPKPAEPRTWAQAMLGALLTFAYMMLIYGTIPHEWLNFANSYLHWTASKLVVDSGQQIFGPFHWLNFKINQQAVADTVVTIIYVVMLVINVYLIVAWQKRPIAQPKDTDVAPEPEVEQTVGTSAYGRPVTVKS